LDDNLGDIRKMLNLNQSSFNLPILRLNNELIQTNNDIERINQTRTRINEANQWLKIENKILKYKNIYATVNNDTTSLLQLAIRIKESFTIGAGESIYSSRKISEDAIILMNQNLKIIANELMPLYKNLETEIKTSQNDISIKYNQNEMSLNETKTFQNEMQSKLLQLNALVSHLIYNFNNK
jgi:uncharacterized protein (DUF342 family)